MRQIYTRKRSLATSCLGLALLRSNAVAGTCTNDFNSAAAVGRTRSGTVESAEVSADTSGNTANTTGVLKLTKAEVPSNSAGAILDVIDGAEIVSGFEANFLLHIGRGSAADGMSFFFGDFADGSHS